MCALHKGLCANQFLKGIQFDDGVQYVCSGGLTEIRAALPGIVFPLGMAS